MTSRAQTPLSRGRSISENLIFQLCCVNKCKTKKSARRLNKKHSSTSPDVRIKEISFTKQKTRPSWKFGSNKKTRPRMNYEWIGKTIKKTGPKIEKSNKNQSEIAACEQQITSEKAKFFKTSFSHYFKVRAKNFTQQNQSVFRCTSCFEVTKITSLI